MAKIFVRFNEAVIKEVPLVKDETTFGRKEDNDIVIDNPTVSGHHGKIIKEGGVYYAEDLNSTNGTYINGRRIKKDVLHNKDQIRVARHILEFSDQVDAGAPAAQAAPPPAVTAPPPAARPAVTAPPPAAKHVDVKPPAAPAHAAPAPAASAAAAEDQQETGVTAAIVKIISGAADQNTEIHIKDLVTYIGTASQALIKIKGLMAPSLAAAISKKKEGYFLNAIKPGYPKVNGVAVNQSVLLESGALLELGGTNMVFYYQRDKKEA